MSLSKYNQLMSKEKMPGWQTFDYCVYTYRRVQALLSLCRETAYPIQFHTLKLPILLCFPPRQPLLPFIIKTYAYGNLQSTITVSSMDEN